MQTIHDSLLGTNARSRFKWKCNRQCSASLKSVLLILIWNFLASAAVALFTSPDFYTSITSSSSANLIKVLTFGLSGFLLLFYPLATWLADQKWGHYKAIVHSLYCFLCTATVISAFGGALIAMLIKNTGSQTLNIGLGVPIAIAFLLSLPSLIIFRANVLQFGADQLIDRPSENLKIYVYSYVWSSCAGTALVQIVLPLTMLAKTVPGLTALLILVPILAILILGATLTIQCCKSHWFIADQTEISPYKLVYQVINYVTKNKHPLHRSAFTYWEDDCPTKLDFAKERFGGPFTTEQVENVKTLLRILCVLLALGPVFAVDIAAGNQLPTLAYHLAGNSGRALLLPLTNMTSIIYPTILALNGSIPPLIIAIAIPLYICLLWHYMSHKYILNVFKQMGLGMIILLASLITTLLLDTVGHTHSSSTTCFLVDNHYFNNSTSSSISPLYIMIPYTLNAFAYMLLYIGIYQFILSQSPCSMRGLVIGCFFVIKGVFQLLAVLTVYLPFITWSSDSSFPSCGFVYYLINIAIALIGIIVYTLVTRKYQYRVRCMSYYPFVVEEVYDRYIAQEDEDLVYRVSDDNNWVCREPDSHKKDDLPSNSQATDTHTQENATGNMQNAESKLPDHISSRNKM